MKITAEKINKLTLEAQKELLDKIIQGIKDHDARYDDNSVAAILTNMIMWLDEYDEDDYFGTEGWRHSILGED